MSYPKMIMKLVGYASIIASLLLLGACSAGQGSTSSSQTEDVGASDGAIDDAGDTSPGDAASDARSSDAADGAKDDADLNSDAAADSSDTARGGDADTGPGGPFVVWMAPNGDDARSGLTEANSVLTLERVEEILEQAAPQTDVEVRIASGRYRGQSVEWRFSVPGHTVTLTRVTPDDDRPVFDGCLSANDCPGGTWFRLRRSDGAETSIVFNYLQVENYQTAISLDGNRNDEAKSNGSNRIYGCYFSRIGNVFNSGVDPSTAAVRLVNSDDNEIANNHFVDIINTTALNRLHAIYVAHMSDRNEIARNRFVDNSGDPVRVRDYSNDNSITDNTFEKAGQYAGYTEWYCDHDARTDCTKQAPECPSWGNEFRRNHLDGNYDCQTLGTFEYFQDDATTGCSPPTATSRRLRTSDNTRPASPCAN